MPTTKSLTVSALLLLLAQPTCAFAPAGGAAANPRPRVLRHATANDGAVPRVLLTAVSKTPPTPPASGPATRPSPLPDFEWPVVLFFAANPLILLPVAALAAAIFHLGWLGALFSAGGAAWAAGAALAVPMLALSLVADKVIPALAEVTRASQTISLYALGTRLRPLRAAAAAVIISTSAAVSEELAFRGCLQTGVASLLMSRAIALPAATAAAIAVTVQALIFGVLHSYSARYEYLATASVAGLAFGAAFARTSNIAVPMVMHFIIDVVGFLVSHWQVARASETEQRDLIDSDTPIAQQLRQVLGPRALAREQQKRAAAAGA